MPATTSDEAALLAAIAAHPAEDSVRLAYADWLDEQGDERVTCWRCGGDGVHTVLFNGKPDPAMKGRRACGVCSGKGHILDTSRRDRAELIRVQVELEGRKSLGDGHTHKLLNRETALRDAHPEWLPECPACLGAKSVPEQECGTDGVWRRVPCICPHCAGSGRCPCDVRRGFVEVVRVPTLASVLENVLAVDCPTCRRKMGEPHHGYCSAARRMKLVPTDYAVNLLDRFPTVRGVVPVDRVPLRYWSAKQDCVWYDMRGGGPYILGTEHHIYPAIWDAMQGEVRDSHPHLKFFPTPEAAVAALGVAVADVLRPG